MKEDVRRVSKELAGEEKERFDYYLHAYESMSARLARLKGMEQTLSKVVPTLTENYSSDDEAKRLVAQFELAGAALIGGLTNVVTICSGLCNVNGNFPGLGIGIGIHAMPAGN